MNKFLLNEYKILLKSEKPDKYGAAFIKNSCNYAIKIGGKEKMLKIIFYRTTNAIDVRLCGSPQTSSEKFAELGYKNVAVFFVEDVFPRLVEHLYQNCDVNAAKVLWKNLAKEGYEETSCEKSD